MKKEELLEGLTKEQIEKAKNCKDSKELLALSEEEGVELNDEQLEFVSGGGCLNDDDNSNKKKDDDGHRKIDS